MPDEFSNQQTDATRDQPAKAPARSVEDLTLPELFAQLWRRPVTTWRSLRMAGKADVPETEPIAPASADPVTAAPVKTTPVVPRTHAPRFSAMRMRWRPTPKHVQLLMYTIAIVCALVGASVLRGNTSISRGADPLNLGAAYLWLGFFLWLAADILINRQSIRDHWRRLSDRERRRWLARLAPGLGALGALYRLAQSMGAPREASVGMALSALALLGAFGLLWLVIEVAFSRTAPRDESPDDDQPIGTRLAITVRAWKEISHLRKLMFLLAAGSSVYIWLNTSGNRIQPPVLILWLFNCALWCFVFAPLRWNVFDWTSGRIDAFRRIKLGGNGLILLALALTLAAGAWFRIGRLEELPGEMQSDVVINILDAYRIHVGSDERIFLSNNGGREPVHVYLYALFGGQPGVGFNRYTINLLAALESLATLPLMFWLGCEVMGRQRRGYALGFAVLATALLAVGNWHVVMARQGLRISVSPLITTLSAVYFVRGLRHNRRSDYVLAGLTLALGLYSYKSLRMLPVVYVVCVGIAMLLKRGSWRVRAPYLFNLATLAFVACMVFVPMFHFWLEYPDQFTGRMTTRMFGDNAATPEERMLSLNEDGATFLSNMRNSLLMFHATADSGLVSAAPFEPAMDEVAAALLALGFAAWLTRMASSRDPVNWFVPCLLLFMLFIPALAIAFPIEVPHYQRSSSGMPAAFLIAALPLALYCRLLHQTLPRRIRLAAIALVAGGLLLASFEYNYGVYYGRYQEAYRRHVAPHSVAGNILRGFAESDGAYGNAFIVSYPYWWDHRAVGLEGGVVNWNNSADLPNIPGLIRLAYQRAGEFRLEPERDLLFYYSQGDDQALPQLQAWFPNGRATRIDIDWDSHSFFIYRVPALGQSGLQEFVNRHA